MSEDLLPYYNRELAFLRRMGAEFAKLHPKVAGRLRLGAETVEDPHVARLIESAAFLNARVRHKLEDDFPELTDAMLSVLYPHYLRPIPSMSIVQFEAASDITEPQTLAVGTMLETDRAHGEPCRYRTCYPVELLPIEVRAARLSATPFEAPPTPRSSACVAVLRIDLATPPDGASFEELAPGRLRFFLKGQAQHVNALHEALSRNVVDIALATSPSDSKRQLLPADSLRPVGFGGDEGMFPYPKRSFRGYRLLTEYFAFPEKFLFLDLEGLAGPALVRAGRQLQIYVYLSRTSIDLQQNISADTFALGCAPVVNLFSKRAESSRLTQKEPEVRVVPDARRAHALEVYSIDHVSVVSPAGATTEIRPFYGIDHGARGDEEPVFWHASRRPASATATRPDKGTEVYLSFVDSQFGGSIPSDSVLTVETSCLNRDLPSRLPFGGGAPKLEFSDGGGPVKSIRCLTAPTSTVRPKAGDGARWQLISHLALNHMSLSDEGGAEALREILRLYELTGTPSNVAIVESILSVSSRPAAMRVTSGTHAGFCRGTEVRLHLDEERFADHGLYLFASVLEVFFGLYCSINSFVQLTVTTNRREGELCRWPPRAGMQQLI